MNKISEHDDGTIDRFPLPCYSDANIIVVVNEGTYSVKERGSSRSECYFRDFYVTNLSPCTIVSVIKFKDKKEWNVVPPGQTRRLSVSYYYESDYVMGAGVVIKSDEQFGTLHAYLMDESKESRLQRLLNGLKGLFRKAEDVRLKEEEIDNIEKSVREHDQYSFRFDINVYSGKGRASYI